jgi:hypothetical protein
MTSLSSKLSDYKSKGQQPSVALSTTSEAKKLSETSSTISPKAAIETKQQLSPNTKAQQANTPTKVYPFANAKSFAEPQTATTKLAEGWDDNEWKEMDDNDEDQMEPLEDYYGSNTKTETSKTSSATNNWDTKTTGSLTSNWSQPANTKPFSNEEDMFTTLVKDVSSVKNKNKF